MRLLLVLLASPLVALEWALVVSGLPLVVGHSLGRHGASSFHWDDSLPPELARPTLFSTGAGYRGDPLQSELGRPSLLTAGYLGEGRDNSHEASLLLAGFVPSIFHARPDPNQGCGPNPLIQLVREMPFWLEQSLRLGASGSSTQGDMLRYVRSDNAAFQEFLTFKRKLRRFEDCIKTGDGVRAKKLDWSWTSDDKKEKKSEQDWKQSSEESHLPWDTPYMEDRNLSKLN